MKAFCDSYSLKSLAKEPCFKNPEIIWYVDLILTDSPNSIWNSCAIETGLSDFQKMTTTVMKMKLEKQTQNSTPKGL